MIKLLKKKLLNTNVTQKKMERKAKEYEQKTKTT